MSLKEGEQVSAVGVGVSLADVLVAVAVSLADILVAVSLADVLVAVAVYIVIVYRWWIEYQLSLKKGEQVSAVAVVLADVLVAVAVDFVSVCSGGENISCPSRKENRSVLLLFL